MASDFQESVLAVKEVEEQPAHYNVAQVRHHLFHVLGEQTGNAAEEELVGGGEVDHALGKIDGDGVHAHNSENECPLLPSAHVYNRVENGHHDE